MTKYVHCVFVKHSGNNRTFLFAVDTHQKLKDGTQVLCETRYGEAEGHCAGNSFMIDENALNSIVVNVGAELPLKSVVGIIEENHVIERKLKRFDNLPF